MWRYLRIDHLAPAAVCIFCHRPLRSARGIVITDGVQEAFAGPNCAKRMLGNPEERLLDVTRLALLVVSDQDPGAPLASKAPPHDLIPQNGAEEGNRPPRPALPPLDEVIQYLRLRYEFMTAFRFHKSKLLTEAYEQFRATGQLSDLQRRRVAGAIRNAAEQQSVFSVDNVMHCIGVDHWLKEAVEHTPADRREFLDAMRRKLHRNWCLSVGQLEAINKWGARLRLQVHSFPHLNIDVFQQVHVPPFMQSNDQGNARHR